MQFIKKIVTPSKTESKRTYSFCWRIALKNFEAKPNVYGYSHVEQMETLLRDHVNADISSFYFVLRYYDIVYIDFYDGVANAKCELDMSKPEYPELVLQHKIDAVPMSEDTHKHIMEVVSELGFVSI